MNYNFNRSNQTEGLFKVTGSCVRWKSDDFRKQCKTDTWILHTTSRESL